MSYEDLVRKAVESINKANSAARGFDDLVERLADTKIKALNAAIDAGEHLMALKAKVQEDGGKWGDVVESLPINKMQLTKYMRVAAHKVQARAITQESGSFSLNKITSDLPRVNEPPVQSVAKVETLGYVGIKPGTARDSDAWYTPQKYIDMAREVMGSIDLDPFSSVEANERVGAKRILTLADDATTCSWAHPETRTCWMNPPYSRGASSMAVDKFLDEYDHGSFDEAIVLMNASTDTNWYQRMMRVCNAIAFTGFRISFENNDGKTKSGNTKGQVFFYFGQNEAKFMKDFGPLGCALSTKGMQHG
jgi:phage N-6-adenine-methyltransferase